jgi:bacterioferritin
MEFKLDMERIRDSARKNIEKGAVTDAYRGNAAAVCDIMNDALATEIVCWLRYTRHAAMAAHLGGIAGEAIQEELRIHAAEELGHADLIAERIMQLGGEPDYDPHGIAKRAHAPYSAGNSLEQMLTEDLIAERIAIETYSEIIRYLGDRDPTTRRMMEGILAKEEEHADEIADWMRRLAPLTSKTNGSA